MPISKAFRLCPEAMYLRPDFDLYSRVSRDIMHLLRSFGGKFEQVGIDEAYLDVTHLGSYDRAHRAAEEIRDTVRRTLGHTCSIGVGPGRVLAKIASDFRKPDGLTVVMPRDAEKFLAPLPVARIPGIGRKTSDLLERSGIRTIGDLAAADIQVLQGLVGRWAAPLRMLAGGVDQSEVRQHDGYRSVSRETTFHEDVSDTVHVLDTLGMFVSDLASELEKDGALCRTITVKVRFLDFETVTRARSIPHPSRDRQLILSVASALAKPFLAGKPVRLIGVRLSGLTFSCRGQRSIGEFV